MSALQQLALWLHLVAAVTWVGGNIFLALTGPAVRAASTQESLQSMRLMGLRFRWISWIAVGVLVLTGIANLSYTGMLAHLRAAMVTTPFLGWKLIVVTLMIIIKLAHDFFIGPRAARHPENRWLWNAAMALGRLNVILGILILYLAMRLVHG